MGVCLGPRRCLLDASVFLDPMRLSGSVCMLASLCDFPSGSVCFCEDVEPLSHLESDPVVCDFPMVTVSPAHLSLGTHSRQLALEALALGILRDCHGPLE